MRKLDLILLFIFFAFGHNSFAQYIPVHPTNKVYDFLTELSNDRILTAPSFYKPLSRKEISAYLHPINKEDLNSRQLKELAFYMKDFGKETEDSELTKFRLDMLYFKDSLFSLTVNPILGGNYWVNKNGSFYHWWNGAEASGKTGKWAFWGSLRDNHESEYLTQPDFMNQNYGGSTFKSVGNSQVDYWEVRGGVSYDFGMGHIAIMKDHFSWGSNYNGSNILSGRTPSLPHINLKVKPVKWFEFQYVHAWLTSEVIDSTRSFSLTGPYGTNFREVYHGKFLAANLFTFVPFKIMHISVGNSIIYDYDNAHPGYLIPVMFYKAVDHQLNSGIENMNSQLFFDLSIRPLDHFHLYSSLFIDELAVKRITDPDDHNFYSFKAGIHISNLVPNLYSGLEITRTNALSFRHYVSTTTFESNHFNLGHYLEDNANEIFVNLGYKPNRNMDIRISYISSKKGPDHTELGTQPRMKIESFSPVVWESDQLNLGFTWQIINDVYLRASYSFKDIQGEQTYLDLWTSNFYQGKTHTFGIGLNIGF